MIGTMTLSKKPVRSVVTQPLASRTMLVSMRWPPCMSQKP